MDVLKPWITKRTTELLKMEDDVVVEFIFNQLEEKVIEFPFGCLISTKVKCKRPKVGNIAVHWQLFWY